MALWREALLAQAVLQGKTKGYKHHPQLKRFQECRSPRRAIALYLKQVHAEATRRGYRFDGKKIGRSGGLRLKSLTVARGQLGYEWEHLRKKLRKRSPKWGRQFVKLRSPEVHPLFRKVAGGVADWEIR